MAPSPQNRNPVDYIDVTAPSFECGGLPSIYTESAKLRLYLGVKLFAHIIASWNANDFLKIRNKLRERVDRGTNVAVKKVDIRRELVQRVPLRVGPGWRPHQIELKIAWIG